MRRSLPILAVLALATTLTACSSGGSTPKPSASAAAAGDVCATPGGSSVDKVQVPTDLNAAPSATFPAGLTVKKTQRKVVVAGSGPAVAAGGTADVNYVLYDATSGKQLDPTQPGTSTPASFTTGAGGFIPAIGKTLGCVKQGSRVVSVVASGDAFGTKGLEELGVAPNDTLVFVMDVKNVPPTRADGVDQAPQAGFPTVKLAADGTPTVTVPKTDPPTTLQVEVLKKGAGAVIGANDTVTVHYSGLNWRTRKVFDSSWKNGNPAQFNVQGVVAGFRDALVGQTVGSQVVAIIPPDQGYGPQGGNASAGITATDTITFVIDILGSTPAS